MDAPWKINEVKLSVTKHFALAHMRGWGWDMLDLRDSLRCAYKISKVGKAKYEVFVNKDGYKKIVTVYFEIETELLCITGSEGGKPL